MEAKGVFPELELYRVRAYPRRRIAPDGLDALTSRHVGNVSGPHVKLWAQKKPLAPTRRQRSVMIHSGIGYLYCRGDTLRQRPFEMVDVLFAGF
jgi:hypothetical protein